MSSCWVTCPDCETGQEWLGFIPGTQRCEKCGASLGVIITKTMVISFDSNRKYVVGWEPEDCPEVQLQFAKELMGE